MNKKTKSELLNIIIRIDSMSKREIARSIKDIVVAESDSDSDEIDQIHNILDNANIKTCCMPSICSSNCVYDADTDVNIDAKLAKNMTTDDSV